MPLSPGDQILFTRQRHEADRMGLHWDYRLVAGDKAYSWATKKEMPEAGKSIVLFEQPVHDASYALSKKVVIPKGEYGGGTTYLDWVRKANIGQHSTPDQLTIYANGDKFLLKKLPEDNVWGKKGWLFKNLGKQEMSENKYLHKIAENHYHYVEVDNPHSDAMLERIEDVLEANKILKSRGYKPSFNETAIDHLNAREINDAKFQADVRPYNAKGNILGIGTGLALGGLAGLGMSAITRNPVAGWATGIGTAIGTGGAAKGLYYDKSKQVKDDQYQVEHNAILDKILSRYERA